MFLKKIAAVLFLLPVFAVWGRAETSVSPEPETIAYRLKPHPQADRTELEIAVSFVVESAAPVKIKLPTDNFGTPGLHRFVTKFAGENGTRVEAGANETEKIVAPAADGRVALRYTLSYDPKVMDDYAYGPNTGADYFHLAGCQWLLHIGDDGRKRRFRIEIVDAPPGWMLYSSKSANARSFEIESSYDDLISAPFGGGKNARLFNIRQGRVAVFVHGDFEIAHERIFSSIEKIVRLERAWFNDYSQPVYTIVVAPRSDVVAGYAPADSFVCFVKREVTNEELSLLIAHEFFHNWLPNKIEIVPDDGHSDFRFEWLNEGFTDYLAQKIMAQAGIITRARQVELINRNIYNLADNPHRAKTYDELVALGKSGKFDGTAKKLAYYRGALLALNWEARIKRADKKRDLADFMRELFRLAGETKGKISERAFFAFAAGYGIEAQNDLQRYIVRGEEIVPEADALGRDFALREFERPAFDVGFSLAETQKTRKISGVAPNGAAHRAGLRDGMEFVGAENAFRFSNAWTEEKPLVVRVKIDGRERRIEYYPHGAPLKLRRFEAKK